MPILPNGAYLTVLIDAKIRGRRERILAARAGLDLDGVDDALDGEHGRPVAHRSASSSTTCPTRPKRQFKRQLIAVLSTITDPHDAAAGELAAAYHYRREQQNGHDQLKTHLRGPGRVLSIVLPVYSGNGQTDRHGRADAGQQA